MKVMRHLLAACICASVFIAGASSGADAPNAPVKEAPKDLVLKGDAKCTACHDEADSPKLLSIGKTRHGTHADGKTPSCTSCHGESNAHADHKGSNKPPKPERTFDKNTKTPVAQRNDACLSCHQKDSKRHNWPGSVHETSGVACTSCHQVHTGQDKVRDKRTQPEVCFSCHKEQRTEVNKPSHHPILEGKVSCSDCHNAHGSMGPKLLLKNSINATCYTCHAEKRGPFVHNHAPVTENCANCHNPHGTVANSLLKVRPPFLCQQCHDTVSHIGNVPGVAGSVTVANPASNNLNNSVGNTQGRACLNCHTEIHGSNSSANASKALRFWR